MQASLDTLSYWDDAQIPTTELRTGETTEDYSQRLQQYVTSLQEYLNDVLQLPITTTGGTSPFLPEVSRVALLQQLPVDLWLESFTHITVNPVRNYDPYETLGDAASEAAFALAVLTVFPEATEIMITELGKKYMSKRYQPKLANMLRLPRLVRVADTPMTDKIREDIFEAFLGALWSSCEWYLRPYVGLTAVRRMIDFLLQPILTTLNPETLSYLRFGDETTQIKELYESVGLGLPGVRINSNRHGVATYTVPLTNELRKSFKALLNWNNDSLGQARGFLVQEAGEEAAFINAAEQLNKAGITLNAIQKQRLKGFGLSNYDRLLAKVSAASYNTFNLVTVYKDKLGPRTYLVQLLLVRANPYQEFIADMAQGDTERNARTALASKIDQTDYVLTSPPIQTMAPGFVTYLNRLLEQLLASNPSLVRTVLETPNLLPLWERVFRDMTYNNNNRPYKSAGRALAALAFYGELKRDFRDLNDDELTNLRRVYFDGNPDIHGLGLEQWVITMAPINTAAMRDAVRDVFDSVIWMVYDTFQRTSRQGYEAVATIIRSIFLAPGKISLRDIPPDPHKMVARYYSYFQNSKVTDKPAVFNQERGEYETALQIQARPLQRSTPQIAAIGRGSSETRSRAAAYETAWAQAVISSGRTVSQLVEELNRRRNEGLLSRVNPGAQTVFQTLLQQRGYVTFNVIYPKLKEGATAVMIVAVQRSQTQQGPEETITIIGRRDITKFGGNVTDALNDIVLTYNRSMSIRV